MKLLVDMNLAPRWVGVFEEAGIEAAHWSSLGAIDAPDTEIIRYASEHNYVVLTHDLDFGAILAVTDGFKPSVVQIRAENITPQAIGKQVLTAVSQMALELEQGALVSVDPKRTRIRVLPLRGKD